MTPPPLPAPAKVGIFLAGVQKGGTTSLFQYLRQHPALLPPRVKETHHFDNEALDWTRENDALLDACYAGPAAGRQRFEATPISVFWPPSLVRIQAYNPTARLILVFRDPIGRAYSHWHMERGRGTESLPFRDAIRIGRHRLPPGRPLAAAWRDHSYVERGFYGTQLARALSLFPREQLFCTTSDALRDMPEAVLAGIAGFLGIPAFPGIAARHDHAAPPTPQLPPVTEADHRLLRGLFAAELQAFRRLSGLAIDGWPALHPFVG